MSSILIYGGLTVLAFVCVLVVLFVLMQKPSANAGMGSALGGSASESVFGGEAAGVLSRATVIFIAAFFILCAVLYLAFLGARPSGEGKGLKLKEATVQPAEPEAPAAAIVPAEEGAAAPAESAESTAAVPAPESVPASVPATETVPAVEPAPESVPAQEESAPAESVPAR